MTDETRLTVIRELRADCPRLRCVIATGTDAGADVIPASALWETSPLENDVAVRGEDAAAILYTSGTTGFPKGVVLTHGGYVLNAEAFAERVGLGRDDVVLCVLPLSHLNAQRSSVLAAIVAGAGLVVEERFSASRFWSRVREKRVTFFSIMPTIAATLLARSPSALDRAHDARLCVTPASADLTRAFEERFGTRLISTYGLTEGMLNVMNFPEPELRRVGAAGKPIAPDVHQVRIADTDDHSVSAGTVGEIVVRSPAVMREYYKDAAATTAVLRNGWLHTGDLGYLDADGFLFFVGRKKDMIRRGGENVAPAEIEGVLLGHPKVADVAVVGIPDPIREEEIKAFVVLAAGETEASVPPRDLFEYCAARLARFKVPHIWSIAGAFLERPRRSGCSAACLETAGRAARVFDNPLFRERVDSATRPAVRSSDSEPGRT